MLGLPEDGGWEWGMDKFTGQRLEDIAFSNCSLARARFDDVNLADASFTNVNLSGARLENVNLAGLTVENANIQGLRIFGYDVDAWIREQLAKDGCHLD